MVDYSATADQIEEKEIGVREKRARYLQVSVGKRALRQGEVKEGF